jgi:hypothetical protein
MSQIVNMAKTAQFAQSAERRKAICDESTQWQGKLQIVEFTNGKSISLTCTGAANHVVAHTSSNVPFRLMTTAKIE